jgi:sporulation protein YlmC with PRC-barrel domain
MRFFANDVQDKYVMSNDGKYLGTVDNLVVDTKSGKVLHIDPIRRGGHPEIQDGLSGTARTAFQEGEVYKGRHHNVRPGLIVYNWSKVLITEEGWS